MCEEINLNGRPLLEAAILPGLQRLRYEVDVDGLGLRVDLDVVRLVEADVVTAAEV